MTSCGKPHRSKDIGTLKGHFWKLEIDPQAKQENSGFVGPQIQRLYFETRERCWRKLLKLNGASSTMLIIAGSFWL